MSFEKVPNFLLDFFEAEAIGNQMPSYRFNSFLLDVAERRLFRDNSPVQLTPKAFDVLVYLVERGGHLVLKDELMQAIWPDSFVDEVNIPRTVHTIRGKLGEDDNGNKFIETVPTKGYRFVAKVEEVSGNGSAKSVPESKLDEIKEKPVTPGAPAIEGPHFAEDQQQRLKKGYFEKGRWRTVVVLLMTLVVTVLATGFWFTGLSASGKRTARANVQTISGNAFEFYRQGRLLLDRKEGSDLENALASFEKAIELDPGYAAAYAGKADAKIWMFWRSNKHDDISQARAAISKSFELEASNAYAHSLLCRIKATYDWEFKEAETECRRAIELYPRERSTPGIGVPSEFAGRENEALQEIDAAIAAAPTTFNNRSRGVILYYSRRYDDAIEQLRQVEETDPNEYDASRWLINAYEMKKDYARAEEARIRHMESDGTPPEAIAEAKSAYTEGGWPQVLRSSLNRVPGTMGAAVIYAQIGDNEKAFDMLTKAFDKHAIMLVNIAREPRLDPLRDDPRFETLSNRSACARIRNLSTRDRNENCSPFTDDLRAAHYRTFPGSLQWVWPGGNRHRFSQRNGR